MYMCLAIPHRIIEIIDEKRAYASAGNVKAEVRTDLVEEIAVGDPVLVHAGFIIEKLEPQDSEELDSLWEEIRKLAGEGNLE
jgi:hydrogenase expression/formation protein HypC